MRKVGSLFFAAEPAKNSSPTNTKPLRQEKNRVKPIVQAMPNRLESDARKARAAHPYRYRNDVMHRQSRAGHFRKPIPRSYHLELSLDCNRSLTSKSFPALKSAAGRWGAFPRCDTTAAPVIKLTKCFSLNASASSVAGGCRYPSATSRPLSREADR